MVENLMYVLFNILCNTFMNSAWDVRMLGYRIVKQSLVIGELKTKFDSF